MKAIADHLHILDIIEDHQYEWEIAETEKRRQEVERRARKQVLLALVGFSGFELFVHGIVGLAIADVYMNLMFVVSGLAVIYTVKGLIGK